jgi:hypothetical protein
LFSGTHFNPRVWNGSIYYGVTNNPPSFVKYGAGCAGSAGTPTLSAQPTFEPKLGTGFNFSLTSLPAGAGPISLLLGASRLNYAGLTLPYDLSVIGMTACRLYAGADLVPVWVNIGGGNRPRDTVLIQRLDGPSLGAGGLRAGVRSSRTANPGTSVVPHTR